MPIPGVLETFDRLKKLHVDKNEDYATSANPFFNFDEAEHMVSLFNGNKDKVYACMIAIKLSRLAVLLNSGKAPINEAVLDSFDDAIVYMSIWRADVEMAINAKVKPRK